MPKKDKTTMMIVAVLAVALVIVGASLYWFALRPTTIVYQPPVTRYKFNLTTKFAVGDLWAGGNIGTATITIYKYATLEQVESASTSSGVYTTTKALTSGDRYWVYIAKSSAFKYYDVTIPDYESSSPPANHLVNLDFYSVGSYAFKVYDPTGTAIADGGNYNVTAGTNYPTFTVMMGPPSDDTGVMNTYDPVKALDREVLFYFRVTGNATNTASNTLIILNVESLYSVTTTDRYFGFTITPGDLVRDKKPDGTYVSEGIKSFSLSMDASGVPAAETIFLTFNLYALTNKAYMKTYTTHPTSALSIQSGAYNFQIITTTG